MNIAFQNENVTLWHGDCREVIPTLPPWDVLVTDPPYPGLTGGHDRDFAGGVADRKTVTESIGNVWRLELAEWLPQAWAATRIGGMVFCSYHTVADVRRVLPDAKANALGVWYRRNSPPTGKNLPRYTSEFVWMLSKAVGLAWDAFSTTVFDVPMPQAGCMATERFLNVDGTTLHPTQKPVALMAQLLAAVRPGQTVCDPFAGTGTTLMAAAEAGLTAVGIERDERFADVARRRLERWHAQGRLDFGTANDSSSGALATRFVRGQRRLQRVVMPRLFQGCIHDKECGGCLMCFSLLARTEQYGQFPTSCLGLDWGHDRTRRM